MASPPAESTPSDGNTRAPTSTLLEVRDVSRGFPGVQALTDVSLSLGSEEVVGLIGENGAGKSTLLNIMSGVDRQDSGEVFLRGEPIHFGSYRDANHAGVFRIFQELALVPTLTVYENMFLTHENHFSRAGFISRRGMIRRCKDLLAEFQHDWVDPTRETARYDFSTRQVLEIIKAFALAELLEIESPVILLDEPTAGLAKDEIDFFTSIMKRIRGKAGLIFVSHRLTELLEFSDRIYVIKDGVVVAQPSARDTSESELHHLMVGRKREEEFYREGLQRTPDEHVVLSLGGFSQPGAFEDIDLDLRAGEIVGLAGVIGSGKSELARAAFGASSNASGSVSVAGEPVTHHSIATMMEAGVGYVSADRALDGILLGLPLSWNISLASLASGEKAKWILDLKGEDEQAGEYLETLRIKAPNVAARAGTLSGGTQQKVVLARWLARGVDVLILDNPTKGIDAGAKEDIYEILRELVSQGKAILFVSDELVELIGMCNRVLVMKDGRVTREVMTPPSDKPQEASLVANMV